MAKEDFCFTYYDGDATRDMQHMDRLCRGAYNDLIIMQRKVENGLLSINHIKAVLGKDFESCWYSLEIILKKEGEFFYIEWVKKSVEKMKKNAKKQQEKIIEYWNKVKNGEIEKPKNGRKIKQNEYHLNTNVLKLNTDVEPLENGNENGNGNGNIDENKIKKAEIKIPAKEEFLEHCAEVLQTEYPKYEFSLISKFETWIDEGWKDGNGKKIKNWKTKINNTIPYLKPIHNGKPIRKTAEELANGAFELYLKNKNANG